MKAIVMSVAAFLGLISSTIESFRLVPYWTEVLKLYFIFDSLVPVLIAAMIGFYNALLFLTTDEWF